MRTGARNRTGRFGEGVPQNSSSMHVFGSLGRKAGTEPKLQSRLASLLVRSAGTIHSYFSVTSSKGSSSRLNQGSTETCKGKLSLA